MRNKNELYDTWNMMLNRCYNKSANNYHRYGGRGIDVCREWQQSLDQFCIDVGQRPEGHQLDRIDNDKGYYPENVRWVTPSQNSRNRRDTRWLTSESDGRTLPLVEWGEIAAEGGLSPRTFFDRIYHGRTVDQALNDPKNYRRNKRAKAEAQA